MAVSPFANWPFGMAKFSAWLGAARQAQRARQEPPDRQAQQAIFSNADVVPAVRCQRFRTIL
jgi:hypothetical protein